MLNSITSVKNTNGISFQGRKAVKNKDITAEKPNKESGKKLLMALGGLAVMGTVFCTLAKKNPVINHSTVIEHLKKSGNKKIEKTFKTFPQRGRSAVKLYNAMDAQNKALVLEYKLNNNLFEGKSPEVIDKIKNNLEMLRGNIK